MTEISFAHIALIIAAAWLAVRAFAALKNGRIDWRREAKLLLVCCCFIVLARIVYFPWHLENGRIGLLRLDISSAPGKLNLVPFKNMLQKYDGWLLNLIGNVSMFIPVGIIYPLCFKRLDNIGRVTLAGFGLSLFIELTQLLFYERTSDVDDLILNTLGTLIGAAIYFAVKRASARKSTVNAGK